MVLEVLSEWGLAGSRELEQLNGDLESLQKKLVEWRLGGGGVRYLFVLRDLFFLLLLVSENWFKMNWIMEGLMGFMFVGFSSC